MAEETSFIYDLRTFGFDNVHKQLNEIEKDFEAIKKAKKAAEESIAGAKTTAEAQRYRDELHKIKLEEAELRKQRQQMTNDAKADQLARQAAIREEKERGKAAQTSTGWYKTLTDQIKELGRAIKTVDNIGDAVSFQGQTLQFDAAIAKLKQLTAAEQDFRRQFAKDQTLVGEYTTGIVNAFKQMGLDDLIAGQVTRTQDSLNKLNLEFNELQKELRETQAAGLSTNSIEKQMIENRNEVIKLDTSLARLRTDLRGVGDIGNQVSTSISKGFANVKGQLSSLLLQYVGVQALINQIQSNVSEATISSDQFTELEIQLNNDAIAAEKLNDSLKELDTRTTLVGLQQIADVALKAGATSENIAGITEAIDKTKIAFGKDFGSVEQGTETFAKLISIFFDDGQITGDRILKIGNSIRTLANETVASVPFLNDFAGRMAGLRQITNITLPDILGLGAGFEQFKQSAEVSSTVLVKVIPKLASDIEKFSKIAGLTQEQFTELINNNPAEALITVSEALVKSGTDITSVSEALADSELGSGRITTIIGTLGGKADVFRQRIARAGETIEETGAITEAFEKKNNNLAATIDKLNKKLKDSASSKGFQVALTIIVTGISFLISALPILIGLLGLYALGWLTVTKEVLINNAVTKVTNAQLVVQRLALISNNVAMGASLIMTKALRLGMLGLNAVLFLLNGALKIVTATMALFNITVKRSPLGLLLTAAAILVPAIIGLAKAFGRTATELDKNNGKLRAMNDVIRASRETIAQQISVIDSWIRVINSSSTSADTKRLAMEKLIEIDGRFSKATDGQIILMKELKEAYDDVTASIKLQAQAQASQTLSAEKQQRLLELTTTRQRIETETKRSGGKRVKLSDFTKTEVDIIGQIPDETTLRKIGGDIEIAGIRYFSKDIIDALKIQEEQAAKEYDAYLDVQAGIQAQIANKESAAKTKAEKSLADRATTDKLTIEELETLIKGLDEQIRKLKEGDPKIKELQKLRASYQLRLDAILGTNKPVGAFKGSRLTGEQKDDFKDIDAERDEQLARLNKALIERAEFIRSKEEQLLKVGEDGKIEIINERRRILIRDEEAFLFESLKINTDAIDAKLQLLKGVNAEERKQIAELNLDKIKQEKDTNDKVFDLRAKALKDQLDTDIANAKEQVTNFLEDPTTTEVAKLEVQLDADRKILEAHIAHNKAMDLLEKGRNDISKKNAEDRAREIRIAEAVLNKDLLKYAEARIADEKKVGDKLLAEFQTILNKQRETILNSNKSPDQKKSALDLIDKQDNIGTVARQIAALKQQLPIYKNLLANKKITEEEYAKFYAEYVKKLNELNGILIDNQTRSTDLKSLITNELGDLFGFEKGSEQAKLFAETLTQTFDLAKTAMDDFFGAEQDQINHSLELQLQRLEIEKRQQLERAQTKEEEESINKQFTARELAANKEAFEKNKKIQREQAKINLGIQLSNLAVIAFAPNPANIATLGIAGAIMYAIQAALAFANYAANVKRINSATFEKGGMPGDVPTRGGRFKGKAHRKGGTPFSYQGEQFEAEVDELAIIRTKDAPGNKKYNISGTHTEIASALNTLGGGVNFRTGAKIRKMEKGALLRERSATNVLRTKSRVIDEKLLITSDKEITTRLNQEKQTNEKEISERIFQIRKEVIEKDRELLLRRVDSNYQRVERNVFKTSEEKQVALQEFTSSTIAIEKRYNNLLTLLETSFNKTITVKELPGTLTEKGKQFAMGGVPFRGGEFGGKPHSNGGTPFMFRGRQYEAEVDELAVIRTRNAPRNKKFKVEGTQMEIASAINRIGGGVDFKPGASVKKFDTGGFIGQNLQAPVFTTAGATAIQKNSNEDIVNAIKDQGELMKQAVGAINSRVDRIEVVQVTNTVTAAQKKQTKQSNVGTL